jgi:hypothetical protein
MITKFYPETTVVTNRGVETSRSDLDSRSWIFRARIQSANRRRIRTQLRF